MDGDLLHLGQGGMCLSVAIEDRVRSPLARKCGMAAEWVNVESIGSHFESLLDPRHT
jgi:hypothetical protein